MKTILSASLFFLLLISCSSEKENNFDKDTPQLNSVPQMNTNFVEIKNKKIEKDTTFIINFDKLQVRFSSNDIYNKRTEFEKNYQDSMIINAGLGESFEDKKFEIFSKNVSIEKIEVFESYQTSVGISDEGAHLDLLNWKHFDSEWEKLNFKEDSFIAKKYSQEQAQRFPKVTTKQILQAVYEEYGAEENKFSKLARDCQNANDYPCSVMINRYSFKIVITDNKGQIANYFIVINLPMGC